LPKTRSNADRKKLLTLAKQVSYKGYPIPVRMGRASHLEYRNRRGLLTEKNMKKMLSSNAYGFRNYQRGTDLRGNVFRPKSKKQLTPTVGKNGTNKNVHLYPYMDIMRSFGKLLNVIGHNGYLKRQIERYKKNYGSSIPKIDNSYRKGKYRATDPNQKVKLIRTQKGNKFLKK